ncbi:MAG: XrtA/PEP-CTERM system histidine kinase PrsK, partial [Woeseia sp.]
MEINELAATGYAIATAMFACLSALMLSRWKSRPKAAFVALASGATAIWAGIQSIGSLGYLNEPTVMLIVEWIRNVAWLIALASILRDLNPSKKIDQFASRYGAVFLLASALLIVYYAIETTDSISMMGTVFGGVILSALILMLAEQIYRNAPFDARSALKYFCIGIVGIFLYDLVIFTLTIVSREMSVNQWAARGFVNALFVVPLGFAAQRSFRLSLDTHFPRQILFFSFALIAASVFMIFMVMADYYVRTYAGTWGGATRIVLFVSAVSAVAILMISATIRARVRVFLMKSFFQYKYDYRKEWLRFISTLSESEFDTVANNSVRAVAQIVNSPGGVVWVQEEEGKDYLPIGAWESELPVMTSVDHNSRLLRFLSQRQWVIDLKEMREYPARYEGLVLESWVRDRDDWWLIVPLLLGARLFGFIILQKPRMVPSLNFEDHDLLRTVGRHVATHIDQAESDRRLAESSQFGTYNRLTAFLMHDLNNLIAQQSLVVKNADKYRHNPDFVDDAIDTIAHSVSRMRRLMEQLSSGSSQSMRRTIDLADVLNKAAQRVGPRLPSPVIAVDAEDIRVQADPERLTTVTEHLIRNAQDATDENGEITIDVKIIDSVVTVRIRDTGCGMTPEFIRERLFRPFDSTKGSQSMGVGAYQVREYVRELGGQLDVSSTPGEGTTFSMRLPLA